MARAGGVRFYFRSQLQSSLLASSLITRPHRCEKAAEVTTPRRIARFAFGCFDHFSLPLFDVSIDLLNGIEAWLGWRERGS